MSTPQEQSLREALDALVQEKTFSLEGLKAIEGIRTKALDLEAQLERANVTIKNKGDEIADLTKQRDAALKTNSQWQAREQEIIKREVEANNAILSGAVNKAIAETWEKSCGLVFRNLEVRQAMFGTGTSVVTQPGGYSSTVPTNHSESTSTQQA